MPELLPLAIAAAAATVGGFVRGYSGFAGPMIMLPVLTILFGPVSAVVTIMLVDLSGNVVLIPDAARYASWRISLPLIFGTAVAMPFGSYLLLAADPAIMKPAIIVAVIVVSLCLLAGWRYHRPLGAPSLFGVGVVSGGFLSAAYIGAIVPLVLYAGPDAAPNSRANIIVWVFVGAILIAGAMIYGGAITETELLRVAILAPFYIGSIYAGSRLFRFVDEALFRRTVLIILICGSIVGVVFF